MVEMYQALEAWSALTMTNTIIEGSASSNIRARQWVHVEEDFHAQLGSEVHLYTDNTWPDCNSMGYASQLAPEPEQLSMQPGQAKNVKLGLELRFQQPNLKATAFPNPCTDHLTVTTNSEGGICSVFDLFGRLVVQRSFSANSVVLSTEAFAAGSYLINVTTTLGSWTGTINRLP
jgi:hypothetical protein